MKAEDHRLYSTWKSMRSRCNNPNVNCYDHYGGRGIMVCDEWTSFWNFVEDMEPSYEEGKTLDRINNDDHYCKENCKWSSRIEQQSNKRNNVIIQYRGVGYTEAELSKHTGVSRTTIQTRRLKGYSGEEIVHGKDTRKYKVSGIRYNLKELAQFLGISPQLLNIRIKRGFTIKELVNEFRGIQET